MKGGSGLFIKQISVFVENKSGRLADVTRNLGDNGIDLIAISISDTTDFGIFRLIVDLPEKAEEVLLKNGFTVSSTDVIAVSVKDEPGSLARALTVLADEMIDIEYMYAVGKNTKGAVVILKVNDIEKAVKVLEEKGIDVLPAEKVYSL
jgi:hypothetical protein